MLMLMPSPTKEVFESTEKVFRERWNFPNVVGCLDGKHVRVRCPKKTGSLYYNYKNYFSVILFALTDANCKFLAIDVGSFGREGDAGIFQKSSIGQSIREKHFNVPGPKLLPNTNIEMPHVFLGDEAFPLLDNLLKPYRRADASVDKTKAIFNYRLSRARRLVENSFGILINRFRIFLTTIDLSTSTLENTVTSACIIHNLLLDERPIDTTELSMPEEQHVLENLVDDEQLDDMTDATGIRNLFKDYFNGAGAIHWQNNML